MPTIIVRPRQDGSIGYTARVRIRKSQKVVHQETMTFSTRSAAEKWGKRREVELEDPHVLALAKHGETTLASVIRWYIDSFQHISQWQRSKQSALLFLEKHEIGKVDVLQFTLSQLVEHVRARHASGVNGATAANDLTWISLVIETAKAARGLPVNPAVVAEARLVCHKLRLISRSRRRERRPTNDELERLDHFFFNRDRHSCSVIPMRTMMWFAIESSRREAEICRLEWDDNDANGRTGLVRDAKHPRSKDGNHLRFKYTPAGWEIAQQQPRRGRYIFPYDPKSVSSAFTEACKILGITDLRFHDLRHEATSRLFELGYEIHEVAQFTLHRSWDELKRYANLRPENLREIVILENGDRVVRPARVQTTKLAAPAAAELIPPMTRASRSPLFTDESEARPPAGRQPDRGPTTATLRKQESPWVLQNDRAILKAHPPEKLRKKPAIPKPPKSRTIRGRLGDDLPDTIPAEVEIAIHEERGSLIVVISLLYGLHSILRRKLEGDESEVSEAVEHTAKWADFTKLSEMLLVKLHVVLENLDNIASGVTNVDPEDVAMAETAREQSQSQGGAE